MSTRKVEPGKRPTPSRTPTNTPSIVMIPLVHLIPSADNKRGPITDASVRPLARSLAKQGCLQPIVVRPHPEKKGHFEIRAGERRWRAAKLAGLKALPAIVRSDDDAAALAVTITENLQRENPHPLKKALTIQAAIDRGDDLKVLAARTGHTERYLAKRASLTRLAAAWQEQVLKAETEASRLSVAHLELIARLPEETQSVLANENVVFRHGFPTVDALRRAIDGGLRSLSAMPWKVDDETLVPEAGACTSCPKRASKHPLLFEADEPQGESSKATEGDRCLDPACFERKLGAHVLKRRDELVGKHPGLKLVQVTHRSLPVPLEKAAGGEVVTVHEAEFVKAKAPKAVPVLVVDGPRAGSLAYVRPSRVHEVNGQAKQDASVRTGPMTLDDRRARLEKRREAYIVSKVRESLKVMVAEGLPVSRLPAKRPDSLALLLAFGMMSKADDVRSGDPWGRYASLCDDTGTDPVQLVLPVVAAVWAKRLQASHHSLIGAQAADAKRMCEVLGLEFEAFQAEAERAIPWPKGWTKLALNGEGRAARPAPRRAVRK